MDTGTVIVAGLGIAGTVTAAGMSPWIADRLVQKRRRREIYAETLTGVWRLRDNAQLRSALPAADALDGPDLDRLALLDAETRLLAGPEVCEQLRAVIRTANQFEREVLLPRMNELAANLDPRIHLDRGERITDRFALGAIADQLSSEVDELERRMRADV